MPAIQANVIASLNRMGVDSCNVCLRLGESHRDHDCQPDGRDRVAAMERLSEVVALLGQLSGTDRADRLDAVERLAAYDRDMSPAMLRRLSEVVP